MENFQAFVVAYLPPLTTALISWFLRPIIEKGIHKPKIYGMIRRGKCLVVKSDMTGKLYNLEFELFNRSNYIAYNIRASYSDSSSIFCFASDNKTKRSLNSTINQMGGNELISFQLETIEGKLIQNYYEEDRKLIEIIKSSKRSTNLLIQYENLRGRQFSTQYEFKKGSLNSFNKGSFNLSIFGYFSTIPLCLSHDAVSNP